MRHLRIEVIIAVCLTAGAQAQIPAAPAPSSKEPIARLLAVSSNWEALAGNVGAWPDAKAPRIPVEFIAVISASGHWSDPTKLCDELRGNQCGLFLRKYVNYSPSYSVITEPGWGTSIAVSPVPKVDECFEFTSEGLPESYQFGQTAVAADAPDLFTQTLPFEDASPAEIAVIRARPLALGPAKVKSFKGVMVRKLQLEGSALYIAQRHYSMGTESGIVFAIGSIVRGRFELLRWNPLGGEDGDTVESALGVIRLKSGKEFLLTVEHDPEGHVYYAYGLKNGRLAIVFKGGGSSC
jgi:hypothetical protein